LLKDCSAAFAVLHTGKLTKQNPWYRFFILGVSAKESIANDRDSSEYIRSFFDIDWNDQNMYDLVLNTRTMSMETSTALIIAAITAQEFRDRPEQVEKSLADMALAQLTQGALVGFAGIDLTSVEVAQGVVILAGLASSHKRIEECKKTVSRLKGVKEVRGMLEVVPLVSM
jgi:hypothetical protein